MKLLVDVNPVHPDYQIEKLYLPMPNKCPHCRFSYLQKPIESFYSPEPDSQGGVIRIYSLHFCPQCEEQFLARYTSNIGQFTHSEPVLLRCFPSIQEKTVFSSRIKEVSPKFVEIFHQSEEAESKGLFEICGMGYRKALEFLIKDYLISIKKEEETSIALSLLSPCIQKYLENEHLKTLATASAWIGNDEVHYTRKHEDYNLKHLKLFLSSVVSFIDSEIAYSLAKSLLSPKAE